MNVDLNGLGTKIKACIPENEPTGLRFMVDEMVRNLSEQAAELERLRGRLAEIAEKLDSIVCTEGEDAGVVFLSQEGPRHPEVINGKTIQVYDHEYFSPLGDALMELWKLAKGEEETG